MNKGIIIVILATLLLIVGGMLLMSRNSGSGGSSKPLPSPTSYEYYWGNGCPHCKNVENFLSTWDKKDKVSITKYEVWDNASNAKRMQERVITCGIDPKGMGVPLLFTLDGKCLDGDEPIIKFFKELKP